MLPRAAAIGALVIGLWSALAVISVWGAGGGAIAAPIAIILAVAALTEPVSPRLRRTAFVGLAGAVAALVGLGILVVLALLGL